jgi:multidrug transporter EmrE-like cation transporter
MKFNGRFRDMAGAGDDLVGIAPGKTTAALYIGSFAVWLVILGRNELSVAYPIAIGLTLAFSTCTTGVMLGEVLTAWRIGGIALVFLGILTICKILKSAAVRTEGVTAPTC